MTDVKICGIRKPEHLETSYKHGARYAGFVFFDKSPRFIEPELARILSRSAPTGLKIVGLFVDPDDALLERVLSAVPIDIVQLHGKEPPVRVQEIRSRTLLPVMKAIPVATEHDLLSVTPYEQVADWLLFDAKAPPTSSIPGGNGVSFDWNLLQGKRFHKPWMLSGGLHSENIKEALSILHPDAVDVSSGVESSPGEKDSLKIAEFLQAARNV